MTRLQPVIWTKGTFLSPQHLQIQDRFLESVLHFQLETLSFRPWGFRSLQIGQEALAEGSFTIAAAFEIDRTDWGVDFNAPLGAGGLVISEKVNLEFDIAAVRRAS